MFNFDAETFVIVYPYAAGGRFLQMAMSLDPTVHAAHTDSYKQPSKNRVFTEYKRYLETAGQHNAHYNNSGHLPDYDPKKIAFANRYVFCLHQVELAPALKFFRQCQNLKIFVINTSTEETANQLKARRWFFAQRVELAFQDGYKLLPSELQTIRSVNETFKFRVGVWPIGSIELEDYWNPEKAVPALNEFFASQNINCEGWEELYHLWINNAIRPTLNESYS